MAYLDLRHTLPRAVPPAGGRRRDRSACPAIGSRSRDATAATPTRMLHATPTRIPRDTRGSSKCRR